MLSKNLSYYTISLWTLFHKMDPLRSPSACHSIHRRLPSAQPTRNRGASRARTADRMPIGGHACPGGEA